MKTKLLFVLAICLYLIPAMASGSTLPPTVIISYSSPICNNSFTQSVAMTGTGNYTGGTFTAAPSGLVINATTGAISPSASFVGTYVVTYTIPAGVDPEVQTTATVQILAEPNAGIDGNTTVCDSSSSIINLASLISGEQAGGVWARVAGTGGTFNAVAGVFTPGFGATTSMFTYTVSGIAPCLSDTSTAIVTINAEPFAGQDSTISVCASNGAAIDLYNLITGEQPGGIWTRTSGTGGTFNASGIFTPEPENTTTSTFSYTVSGTAPCISDTATVTVNITPEFIITEPFPDVTACVMYILPPLQQGNYYSNPGGIGQPLPAGTEITWSQTIYVYVQSGACTAVASFHVAIAEIIPIFDPIPPQCQGATPIQIPSTSTNGVTGTWTPATLDNTILGTTIYTFTPFPDSCANPTTLSVTVVSCSGITLNAFLDINSNGSEDTGEPKFPLGYFNYEADDSGIVHQGQAPNGVYTITDYNGNSSYDITYTLDAQANSSYSITTSSYNNILSESPYPVYNFPVTILQESTGLQVTLVPSVAPRPGFTYQNTIVYTNTGNTVITGGTISFVKEALLTILSVSELGITPTVNGFTYDFGSLQPFETRSITVVMQVPVIPNVTIGQLLTNSVSIVNTEATINNSHSLTQAIIGAYDPNDKTESHGEEILFSNFTSDDYLIYTIRFENTGNANAENVRINDHLDASLDENSVRLMGSSHDYIMERTGSNLEFIFADIQLPPSVANTDIGKGYMTFKVKPKPGYAVGDIIPNQAAIYFDFNPAIETNIFQTKFVNQLATVTFEGNKAGFFPNPASDYITVFTNGNPTVKTIVIYDLLGKEILMQNGQRATETVSVQTLAKGMYVLEVTASDASKTIKKLLVK